jgi:signal transduction histidine kinase
MLVTAVTAANVGLRRLGDQIRAARALARRDQPDLQQLADQVLRGEQPVGPPPVPANSRHDSDDPLQLLVHDLVDFRYTAWQVILRLADRASGPAGSGRLDQRVEIFVNLARRMQSLVHREIEMLDELEARVEDPDLLKGLFTVDHLATRMRRQSESLAVLGGSASRRQWTRHVTMHEVLRAAIAEVEQYSRVRVVPPVEGVLRGGTVTDVIHLIAELVENATKFSPPRTQALIRAQPVAAGVAIEIEDRGLGMVPADMQRMNMLLSEPGGVDIGELLHDGRIGLYVVSTLASRHGIRVQLQSNIYGGTSAIVVLPTPLLEGSADYQLPWPVPGSQREQEAALPVGASAVGGLLTADAPGGGGPVGDFPSERVLEGATSAGDSVVSQQRRPAQSNRRPFVTPPPAPSVEQAPSERPPLPRRSAQASLAPELRDRTAGSAASSARHSEPPNDQLTGLMADFLKGVSRSEKEEPPSWTGTAR